MSKIFQTDDAVLTPYLKIFAEDHTDVVPALGNTPALSITIRYTTPKIVTGANVVLTHEQVQDLRDSLTNWLDTMPVE